MSHKDKFSSKFIATDAFNISQCFHRRNYPDWVVIRFKEILSNLYFVGRLLLFSCHSNWFHCSQVKVPLNEQAQDTSQVSDMNNADGGHPSMMSVACAKIAGHCCCASASNSFSSVKSRKGFFQSRYNSIWDSTDQNEFQSHIVPHRDLVTGGFKLDYKFLISAQIASKKSFQSRLDRNLSFSKTHFLHFLARDGV